MKYLILTSLIFVTFFSCKEKEKVVDPCTNGYLDIGETKIDCGGNCDPCPVIYIPTLKLSLNGKTISFPYKSISFSNNIYSLAFNNDSLSFQLNLGSDGSVNTFPITTAGTYANVEINGSSSIYTNSINGIFTRTLNDAINKKMNGFFNITFYKPGLNDTLRISNGQFSDLSY